MNTKVSPSKFPVSINGQGDEWIDVKLLNWRDFIKPRTYLLILALTAILALSMFSGPAHASYYITLENNSAKPVNFVLACRLSGGYEYTVKGWYPVAARGTSKVYMETRGTPANFLEWYAISKDRKSVWCGDVREHRKFTVYDNQIEYTTGYDDGVNRQTSEPRDVKNPRKVLFLTADIICGNVTISIK